MASREKSTVFPVFHFDCLVLCCVCKCWLQQHLSTALAACKTRNHHHHQQPFTTNTQTNTHHTRILPFTSTRILDDDPFQDIFSPRPPSSASASPSMSVEAPSSGPCDPSPTSHATQQGTNMPSTAAAANEDSVLFATPLGPAPKRRGRPPKNVKVPKDEVDSTETENTDSTVLLPASQGESRRRSSRLKKLEKEKEPDLNGISNGHTLSNTHHTASKEKSKSKKHRHHKKHELDHPTATTDCQITAIAEAPQPQPINAEKHDEPPKELESSSKVLLNRTNEVCNESYPKFEEIDANIFCCER